MKYFRETKAEMKNVVWPSRQHVMLFTALTVIIAVFVAYYVGLFDFIFAYVLGLLI